MEEFTNFAKPDTEPVYRKIIADILTDPTLSHVYFDLSWDEVAKYIVETPESLQNTSDIINLYPDRFLFGTDNVRRKTRKHISKFTKCMLRYGPG